MADVELELHLAGTWDAVDDRTVPATALQDDVALFRNARDAIVWSGRG
jgi:hypothetical protein